MSTEKILYVQSSHLLNGVLRYSSLEPNVKKLFSLDSYGTLRNRDRINDLDRLIRENEYSLKFESDEARESYENLLRCSTTEFEVNSPFLVDHKLFPFQHVGLNYVWNRMHSESPRVLLQWDTGAGKTLHSCLMSQKLFDNDDIDMVLVFCQKKIKLSDWKDEFERMTTLDIDRPSEKMTRAARHKFYKETKAQVIILNYEKVRDGGMVKVPGTRGKVKSYNRTDLQEILEMIKGKRVLVIIDEAQKINAGVNLLSEGFSKLINNEEADMKTIALTATPYTTSPLNIHNIFAALEPGIPDVSDMSRDMFKHMYGEDFSYFYNGPTPEIYVKKWDQKKLPLLGKKQENWTHIAMRSDPVIAAQFPESIAKRVIYELSDIDREIYEWAKERAREKYNPDNQVANWAYVNTLRMICNTTEGLKTSNSRFAKEIVEQFGDNCSITNSAKYQLIENNLEEYIENGKKCVLFTYWTNNTLFPYVKALKEKFPDIPVLAVWGVGMSDEEAVANVEKFNRLSGPAILITSDVIKEGVNLYAPYLWNIEVPLTYAEYKQRKDRINRADSRSKGIETTLIYRSVALDTVEEIIDREKLLRRRDEASAIRGIVDDNVDMNDSVVLTPRGLLF